jgi:hypothetical protein
MNPCNIEASTTTKAMLLDIENEAASASVQQKRRGSAPVHEGATPLELAADEQQEMDVEEKERKPHANKKARKKAIVGKDAKKKKLTVDELKQRNAIYSKRKYDRKKIESQVQQDQCKRLHDQNHTIKAEYARLQELCARAQKCVQDFRADQQQQLQQQQPATSACPAPQDGGESHSTSIAPLVPVGTSEQAQQELRQKIWCEQVLQRYQQEQEMRAKLRTVEVAQAVVRQCDHGQQQQQQQQQLLAEIASLLRQNAAAAYHHQDLQKLAPLLKTGDTTTAEHVLLAGDIQVAKEGQEQHEQHQPPQSTTRWNDGLSLGSVLRQPMVSAPTLLACGEAAGQDGEECRDGSDANTGGAAPATSGSSLPQQGLPSDGNADAASSTTHLVNLVASLIQEQQQQQHLVAEIGSFLCQNAAATHHQDLHCQQLLAPLLKTGDTTGTEHAFSAGDLEVAQEDQKHHHHQQQQPPPLSIAAHLGEEATRWNNGLCSESVSQRSMVSAPNLLAAAGQEGECQKCHYGSNANTGGAV